MCTAVPSADLPRGNERRHVFRDDLDQERFLSALAEAVQEHGLVLHAYCLMPNHYQLIMETPRANLSKAVGWLEDRAGQERSRRAEVDKADR